MNKKIKTEISIGIILAVTIVIGSLVWLSEKKPDQDQLIELSICSTESDCTSLKCPHKNEIFCKSVQTVTKRCVDNECVCRCELPDYNLPKSPIVEELNYGGNIYVKTDEKYTEYISEDFRVELENKTSIYFVNGSLYTLYAADPHHSSYIYAKWKTKK